MNLSITNECNRRCEYCFQNGWYLANKKEDIKEMSLETIDKILDMVANDKNKNIKFMGGEPLLYSRLFDLLQLLREKNISVSMISNITIETSKLEKILNEYSDVINSWLINTDYPDTHESLFLKNIKLFKDTKHKLSTTLMPDKEKIMKSANRILKISSLFDKKSKLRLSPMSPNSKYNITYDYTQDIISFISKILLKGKIRSIFFDCVVNRCEINVPKVINNFKQRYGGVNVKFDLRPCTGAFDVLVDNSVIYCSSTYDVIRLNNIFEYESITDAYCSLQDQLKKYWEDFPLSCDYINCKKYEDKYCAGLCPAKNYMKIKYS